MDPNRDAPVIDGVLRCPVGRGKVHPTEKPIPMLRELVRIVERGVPVLDPFCGSGAHGAAALLEGHPFVGVEMSEHYAAVAQERIEAVIREHGLSAETVRELEARGARVGGPLQVGLFDG